MSDIWLTHHDWCSRQSWPAHGLSFYGAGRQIREPRLVILHSTETTSWPGYGGGAANPHLTIDLRTGHVRQHVPLNYGARALVPGPARTNNIDGVVQVEIIGAVTPGYPKRYGHYDLVNTFPEDDDAHRYLARLLRAISTACDGVPIHVSDWGKWVAYPASYGINAPQRLNVTNFAKARGWLGHQHVPGNDHGDPGALVGLASAVLGYALGDVDAPPATTPGADDPFAQFDAEYVRDVQADLNALAITDSDGNALEEDGIYGERTKQAVRTYQQLTNLDVDGIAGPNTDKSLEDDMALLDQIAKDVSHMVDQQDTQGKRLTAVERAVVVSEGHRNLDALAEKIANACASRPAYGKSKEFLDRGGWCPDEDHRAYPADEYSPAGATFLLVHLVRELAEKVGVDLSALADHEAMAVADLVAAKHRTEETV